MKIEVRLAKSAYLLGETIAVDVFLTNTGTTAVDVPVPSERTNWQPSYSLLAPGQAQPATFSFRSVKLRETSPNPKGAPAIVESLAPGAQFAHGFLLNQWQDTSRPGRYTLRARLQWQGIDVSSQEVTFEVRDNDFVAASLGTSMGSRSARLLYAAWIGGSAAARVIGRTTLYAMRPDLSEVVRRDSRTLRPVGATAADPQLPWMNFDPAEVTMLRYGWREGARLFMAAGSGPQTAAVEFDDARARVVQPSLVDRAGRTCVMLLTSGGTKLALATFVPDAAAPGMLSGRISATTALPAAASDGSAAMAPESLQSACHFFGIVPSANGVTLVHWREGQALRSVDLPGVSSLPGSKAALKVDSRGRAIGTFVGRRDGAAVLVSAVFKGDAGERVVPAVEVVHAAASDVTEAAVAFETTTADDRPLAWVLRQKDGRILSSFHGGTARPGDPRLAASPLQPVLYYGQLFLLAIDAAKGPLLLTTP